MITIEVPNYGGDYCVWGKMVHQANNTAILNASKIGSLDAMVKALTAGADVNTVQPGNR